jgi:peroxiredoxin
MALTYSKGMPLNTSAPAFNLPATDGRDYNLDSFSEAKLLVLVFTCNHCPYAVACEDRLIDIQNRYMTNGVQLVAINSNDSVNYPEDSFENMTVRAKKKSFPFPYLFDESQEVAKAYDAACTPDIFVFDQDRKLRYNGRIDDNWQRPDLVRSKDLEKALDELLAGQDISFDSIASMGCNIKWKH